MNIVVCAHLRDWNLSETDLSFLPDKELAYIKRCRATDEKKRRIAGRLLLKKSLRRFFDINNLPLQRDCHDRPFLDIPQAPDFNISHSGEVVLGSFSTTGKTGIDVEQTARLSLKLIDRYLHDQEKKELAVLPDALLQKRLTDLWTCKEAYSKALGVGMRLHFSKIAFFFAHDGTPELAIPAPEDSKTRSFFALQHNAYRATICFPQTTDVRFYTLSPGGWEEGLELP